MRVFLDFEASSLAKLSYPIEVAWVFEDRRSESYLIKPAPDWVDWDVEAEAVHQISRADLVDRGTPHDEVAQRMLDVLSGHAVYVTAPSWDGKWLSVLLRAAGLPRGALRLREADEAHLETARELLVGALPESALHAAAADILARVRNATRHQAPPHRALPDAELELEVWIEVARLAREEAEVNRASGRGG
jgi:DNA polymerase III epsilon subunit-like protein